MKSLFQRFLNLVRPKRELQSHIDQIKINALSAKILHRESIWKFELINNVILILTIIVPILFVIAIYVSKGTDYENFINLISFILSILLIAVSVLSLIWKVNDKITIHKLGMKNNIYIANECDNLNTLSQGELNWFFRYVSEMDNNDNDIFSKISEDDRKRTYREALKEFAPSNHSIVCPVCNASPWKFIKGNCQLCGNKPI